MKPPAFAPANNDPVNSDAIGASVRDIRRGSKANHWLAAAAFAVALACFFVQTASASNFVGRAWGDVEQWEPLTWLTLVLAGATVLLWWTTRRLAKDSKENAENQLRAYVALEDIYFPWAGEHRQAIGDATPPVQIKVRVRNHGSTPAHQMTIWTSGSESEPSEAFSYPYPSGAPIVKEQMLHPNQHYSNIASLPFKYQHRDLFFIYGRMVYRDIYMRWWVTKFCYYYERENRFTPWGPHNREDGPYASKALALAA